ncbi:Hypothetical protein R9X50_00053700 [Acrodontium crateriforme]|uniref:Glycine zipper 2TM domain-containing protein n=1 Tax=Acrodontium crateriforme TaxID=150365 RepID=A0AAQ3LYA1_9PEZI|nr:Hypothetical protein R9X50_00053700 [Acrodontium crateriforme]
MGDSQFQPPPGQGYHPSMPNAQHNKTRARYDDRDRYAQQKPHDSRLSLDNSYPSRYQPAQPGYDAEGYAPSNAGSNRPYAPSDPQPNDGNMLTPYNEEKAYAEYVEAYGPPPPSAYGYDYDERPPYNGRRAESPSEYSRGGYGDRPRFEERQLSYSDRARYVSRERRYSPRYDDYDRERYRDRFRRRPSRQSSGKDFLGQGDGERGLASAILGAAAGAFLGHKAGKGALGTLSGLAVGAIGANAIEKHVEKQQEEKDRGRVPRRRHTDRDRYSPDPYYRGRSTSRW